MAACFKGFPLFSCKNPTIKLILCEGTTRVLKWRNKMKAGEIMFEFPDSVVCHADSFYLGRPIPILAIHDHLHAGHTYFILPLDRLPGPPGSPGGPHHLSAASLSALGSPNGSSSSSSSTTPRGIRPLPPLIKFSDENRDHCKSPLEYIKDKDGRVYLIKVVPEFIKMVITNNYGESMISSSSSSTSNCCGNKYSLICTTPELQRQYEQLVRAKDQGWSPKLDTISEHHRRIRNSVSFSPSRFMAIEWHKKKLL